jgi:hypothetical protein
MKTLQYVPSSADTNGWKRRHIAAVNDSADPFERSISLAVDAWVTYAIAYEQRFESSIGEDYIFGPIWKEWGLALRGLFDGETGRLDCGTLDTIIVDNLIEAGFEID